MKVCVTHNFSDPPTQHTKKTPLAMAELDTEHVRMLDAGRQQVAYSSPFTSSCFASVASKKTQLLQHGNMFGLSFVATETGFVMTENNELEKSCNDYSKRRQEAMDHGEKLTMDEIHKLPVAKEVQLPSIAYWIALSQDELTLAVAYGDSVALFEVAHIKEAEIPAPFHTFSKMQAQEIMWCTDSASEELAVLTLDKKVVVCTLEGERKFIDTQTDAASISWSPSGEQIAVGLVDGSIAIYARKSLEFLRSIAQPEPCAELGLEAHHVNWAEEELIMAGYQKYDEENEETSALACIFDKDECVELDEVVAFFDVEDRRHQFFSVFLPDWRMFFISCSLSADIELLVSDPDGGEWQLWKPLEKYQARLPMNAEDGESFPMGFALNLNSTTPVPVEEDSYPPVPIISCANTEGLLVNFSFVDTTVSEVDFVKAASTFEHKATRVSGATSHVNPEVRAEEPSSPKKVISHEYGQDAENEFAESDGESSDEEEARKEEEDNARVTFRTMAADGTDYIASDLFPKLFKAMGSTYDEDEHASTVANLEKEGKIYEADFVSWYVDWIFGPDDSDSEEEDDAPAPSEAKPAEMKSKEEIAAAFSKFTAKEGSWKCAMCMINNDREAVKCSSCETPNPAAPKVVAPVTTASATSAGSIGSGGFSFPVSSGDASKTSSFSFGAAPSTDSEAVAATKATKAIGFSFGGAATTTGFNFPGSSTSGTGFNFTSSATSSTGFNFGGAIVKTTSDGMPREEGESNDVKSPTGRIEKEPSSPKKVISHEYGQDAENEFAESDGESSDEEEARKEEEDNARVTFRTMAADGTDYIASDLFPKLFKAMGSTYDEDEHASTVANLEKEGKIYEADFVSWYVDWIFGPDDSDSEEEDDAPAPSEAKPAEMKSKEEIAAAFSKFTAKEGSWKCAMCMINNDREAVKCSSCETPNPAAPKVVAPVTTASATSAGSIGSGGFSFPVSSGDASKTSSFSFGAAPSTDSEAVAATKATKAIGFSFGGAATTTGFNFPGSSTSGTGFNFDSTTAKTVVSSGYPPDTTSKPKPPSFGAASGRYPPDTTSKPKPPSFGAASGGYPPDTTSKPKPPSFGAASGGYPPDTTSKPKPPSFGAASGGYPPDTTSKPKPPSFGAASGGYPPDTTSKPKPPSFGAASGGYPPDTTSKPKPPSFGAASGGYPPDTTSKPKPPSFGAASGGYPPDTTSKPKPPSFGAASGGYPPDTTSKPKPPSFGAASGGYPPDTTSKPKPPSFGAASGGYPPDTTSKPKPPSFGAASGGYPPDTTSKPKPPSFGAASGGYPPDTTSKPKPPSFGQPTTTSSSSSFSSFGKSQFGSTQDSSASTDSSATKTNSFFGNGFGSGTAEKPVSTSSSPFGVVPSAKTKNAFSFVSTSATSAKEDAPKTIARPSFSFDNVSATLESTGTRDSLDEQPRTKRTLNFGDVSLSAAKTNSVPSSMANPKLATTAADPSKGIPSSRMEGQLWKLIIDFHKSLERVNARSKIITSKDGDFSKKFLAQMETIRARISSICDEINSLDESRDQVEKNVLFVIGSDGDVHEQLEYGREILSSFKDEALKRTLEEQPLDQRSKETWESLKAKLAEVEKSCAELDSHLSSAKIGVDGADAVSSAHLFRVLKQTYDNSKMQYNNACKLAEYLEKLNLRGDHLRETNGVNGLSGIEIEAHPMTTKADMIQMLVETEQRSQDVRQNFLSLCNDVVTPRDVFSTPRRKLAPPTPFNSSNSPLRVKACSKLMPKTQLSVASPMSSAKQSSRSVSFKDTPVKSGSKLFTLAEAMAPKEEPAKLVKTPQPTPLSVGVGKAPQRPSLGAPASENKPASANSATSSKSNVFNLPKPGKETTSAFGEPNKVEKPTSTTTSFGGFGVNSPPVKSKRKADEDSAPAFSLGGKEPPAASSAFSFGSKSAAQPLSTTSDSKDYKALLENFYKVHNPAKIGSVLDKVLTTYKGREEDLFTRIFTMYVPDSTPEDIKKYLNGGPVPPKSETVAAASKSPAPTNTTSKSLFGGFGAATTTPKDTEAKPSPFGASPSAFSLGPAANTSSGFGGFGSGSSTTQPSTVTPSAFGQPSVDYRQKLVEFYQKHNPDKLSSVDATLQKYKGNEEKLFQNLAVKYKLTGTTGGMPASPAVQPSNPNATASPFGKPGAFSAPNTSTGAAFGSTSSVGFGASKPAPSASPFGAPASSPFGTTTQSSSGFGSSGGSGFGGGFQSTTATTPAFGAPTPFGAAAGGFGAAAGGVNYREKLTAFYQQHNPTKLSSVDATLEKYKGREDHLFAMLEQKYVKKTPTAPAAGGFGIPSTSTFGGGSGFGTPSALGSAGATPAFGSASTLGGAAQPAFGGAAGSGFGMASQMGGGFGSAAPTAPSGGATGSGFSSFGSQNPSFGGPAQQTGGFGAAANTGGFGSGFGGAAAGGGFGQPTAFNSSSFTQMR
ncbi:Nuclear pore complex protein [Phytophthora citrophthora]|uniref:Nuclear pore complex protein n=1 Tax=Phytophthora citrophthora TaxID=4793 RepID=A0AAD9GX48_9STRA|nr:Nuclear pore complex protein [Phytophthora citrophthora]